MVPECGWPSLSQQTSQPWTFSFAGTQDISTPCLHILSPEYGDEPMSSPVTATNGILLQECEGIGHHYMPCCLPVVFTTPITHTSCGFPSPEWSWQPFCVTRSSSSCLDNCVLHMRLVRCACCYDLPLYLHIICINCDQLTMDFCCRLIPCIQKLNYHLNFTLRTPYQLSRLV